MIRKATNLFLAVLFVLFILLPLLFSDKQGGKVAPAENRFLASFPTVFTEGGKFNPQLMTQLGEWISDNAGGRQRSIDLRNIISYKIFHLFPISNVIEGKEKWLFSISQNSIPSFTNTDLPTPGEIENLKMNFTRITRDFNARGIQFTIMIWPHKYSIYPEYFPDTLTKVDEKQALVSLEEALSGNPDFDFETAFDTLMSNKAVQQDYYKAYDTGHWNQFGAFLGYTALMEQAKRHLPGLKILTTDDFNIIPETKEIYFPWGFTTNELDMNYSLKNGSQASSDILFFNTFDFVSNDRTKSYDYYQNEDDTLPKAVIVGDSFTWMFLLPKVAESFSQLVFIHIIDMGYLDPIINILKPDIVIMTGLGTSPVSLFAQYEVPNN